MRITKAKDGTPVVVGAREYRKSHRFAAVGKSKKEQLQRKGLLGKIPKSEQRLLTLRQRDALRNFVEAGLDPAKTYFEIRFNVRDAKNLSHVFRWRFQPRGPVFRDFLVAVGGKAGPDGSIAAPADYVGKTVKLMIAKRGSKTDPSKMLNEVVAVEPLEERFPPSDDEAPF